MHGMTEYVSADHPVVKLDNQTDYMDTWYRHALTEYVYEDYLFV